MGLGMTWHNWSEKFPAHPKRLFFIPAIPNKGRGAWVEGFSPTLSAVIHQPHNRLRGSSHPWELGNLLRGFVPLEKLPENLLRVF